MIKPKRPSSSVYGIDDALMKIKNCMLCKLDSIASGEQAATQVRALEWISLSIQNLCLIYWREGRIKDAKETMIQILDQTREAITLVQKYKLTLAKSSPSLNEIGSHDLWFDFGRSALFGYLLTDDFEPSVIRLCRSTRVPDLVLKKHYFHIANMNLALSVFAGKRISGYNEFVCDYLKNPRIRLTKKSYLDYGNLIDAASKSRRDDLPELIAVCEENYLKRADDKAFNNFTNNDGISGFNTLHVDYRLAAILKWAYRDYPKDRKKLKTIHQWNWD